MFMVVVYAYIIPMTFINEKHRLNFDEALSRLNQLDRNNYALMSAIYLLTADLRLWFQSKRFVENHGISFGKLRPKNCSEDTYPLYCAAKDLYLGTKHITINDLAVITLLSTIFIIPANAATGDPATITFDYACRPDMSKGCFSSQSSTMSTCSSM